MHTNFTEEELQFEEEVKSILSMIKYPEDIREKQDKAIPLHKRGLCIRWQKDTL